MGVLAYFSLRKNIFLPKNKHRNINVVFSTEYKNVISIIKSSCCRNYNDLIQN